MEEKLGKSRSFLSIAGVRSTWKKVSRSKEREPQLRENEKMYVDEFFVSFSVSLSSSLIVMIVGALGRCMCVHACVCKPV